MIKLIELSFEGIGRFVKKQTINFENREKILQVDGRNLNTGGSSGAGKSTAFHALDYLFGINDISAKDLQSRVGKTKLTVEGTFDIDGVRVLISRSTKDGLTLQIGEESISGNVKLAEERLQALIGIPEKLFKKMIHKKQKEGGFFLKLTAGEMFKFLIKVLNLDHWTDKIDKIDKDIKEITRMNEFGEYEKKGLLSGLEDAQKTLETMVKPVATFDELLVDCLKTRIQGLKEQLETGEHEIQHMRNTMDSEVAALVVPEKQSIAIDMTGINALKQDLTIFKDKKAVFERELYENKQQVTKQINELNSQLFTVNSAKKDMMAAVEKIKSLKAEKTHLESAQCPTCSQTWVGDSATAKLNQMEKTITELAEKAWNYNNIINDEPRIHDSLRTVQERLTEMNLITSKSTDDKITECVVKISEEQGKIDNHLTNVNREFSSKMTEYQNQTMMIKAKYTANISELTQSNSKLKSDIQLAEAQITNHNTQVHGFNIQLNNHNKSVEHLNQSIEDKKQKLVAIDVKAIELKKSIQVVEETKRLIKNYTLQIFQESLDYIGEQASDILSKIPNMANSSIYFEGCKETNKGTIKDEVNAIVNMDGENEINIKTLSGGEETAIELAVDLAVIEMIEHKVGKGANFFILDEPFTGLDSINIQNTMDMLLEFNSDKKIIIVDHNPEIKALISDRITVIRNGEESTIE